MNKITTNTFDNIPLNTPSNSDNVRNKSSSLTSNKATKFSKHIFDSDNRRVRNLVEQGSRFINNTAKPIPRGVEKLKDKYNFSEAEVLQARVSAFIKKPAWLNHISEVREEKTKEILQKQVKPKK